MGYHGGRSEEAKWESDPDFPHSQNQGEAECLPQKILLGSGLHLLFFPFMFSFVNDNLEGKNLLTSLLLMYCLLHLEDMHYTKKSPSLRTKETDSGYLSLIRNSGQIELTELIEWLGNS